MLTNFFLTATAAITGITKTKEHETTKRRSKRRRNYAKTISTRIIINDNHNVGITKTPTVRAALQKPTSTSNNKNNNENKKRKQ